MNPSTASTSTRFKVGLFTLGGLVLIGALTVFVNDRPFWWRGCELVHINIEDATGLKTKSPVRSLGLQIGYLKSVELTETYVRLGICITAPVDVLPSTRAYIRGEGFLGDKFVELKPVKYTGEIRTEEADARENGQSQIELEKAPEAPESTNLWVPFRTLRFVKTSWAQDDPSTAIPDPATTSAAPAENQRNNPAAPKRRGGREIPVGERSQDIQHLVNQVDQLVGEMSELTGNLKQAINPRELRQTMQQLNKTLENASRTLSPEGGLNTTAQRTLAKLEDAIEQMRDQLTRINRGEGSLGKLLNDPTYAEEIREAIRNVNRLLTKVGGVRFVVDIGAEQLNVYNGGRGWFQLNIWPSFDRFYRIGITIDPRGRRTVITTTTVSGGLSTTTQSTQVEQSGILLTGMLGKVLWKRLSLSGGVLHGDGTVSVGLMLGPNDLEDLFTITSDTYSHGQGLGIDNRLSATLFPGRHSRLLKNIYVRGGLDTFRKMNGKLPWFYGAGIAFDDDDIKLLFALR